MPTLPQIQATADARIAQLITQVEANKVQAGSYSYVSRRVDGDVEILINTATDAVGNLGYYIAVFAFVGGVHYQKIVRKVADEADSKNWFIAAMYV